LSPRLVVSEVQPRVEETQDLLLFFRTVRTFSERFDDRTRTFQHFQNNSCVAQMMERPVGMSTTNQVIHTYNENKAKIFTKKSLQKHKDDSFLFSHSPSSRDGYFEMGLDDSGEEVVGSSPSSLPSPVAEGEEPGGLLEAPCEEKADVQVRRVLWCCCVRVNGEVKQREACLVLTDRLLGLLFWSHDSMSANQERGKNPVSSSKYFTLIFL
ncbi:hypothetical protein XENOCAPTIV_020495, partial [Xenoophorus captivus]